MAICYSSFEISLTTTENSVITINYMQCIRPDFSLYYPMLIELLVSRTSVNLIGSLRKDKLMKTDLSGEKRGLRHT